MGAVSSVLVTGGTGSFGRAYVAKALLSGVGRVCIFSRGEHAQAEMRASCEPAGALRWFIGDVRDRDRLRRAMEGIEVVVHAAALKRIEVGHYNPIEMVKTNVMGAVNVIEAACDANVRKVVMLSTDKAYRPVSAYGFSKAMAESLFLAANNTVSVHGPRFAVCRYGNVAGSAGSVIPIWRGLLNGGGGRTVPVTDPDATRFWMTMEEAVDLVERTIAAMRGGELVIPELPAYRLGDLAAAMNAQMRIIGLPAWEKKHEGMLDGLTSDTAPRLKVAQLKERLQAL